MLKQPFAIAVTVVFSLLAIVGLGTIVYYQSLKDSPQYSLALIVDAATRRDEAGVNALVDIDTVVDDFVPQVTDKAANIYGRGLSPDVLKRMARIATPILPAVKDKARAELPRVIRERTEQYGNVPFAAMVLGADRYLDVAITGDIAVVKSKLADHPLEMKMRRDGDRWKIVAVTDGDLAADIAQRIGQEIVAIASSGNLNNSANDMGSKDLIKLLREAEEILR